ncbi:MAG TPA: PilZ domain-containing protein [Allosphingosinicella sp.]|nr:PilZ domain-containing protein [Allosphingosinicella sp.]
MHVAREPRRKVLIRARMRTDGLPMDVCIRDVSSRGLLVQASAPPPRGTYVEIDCGRCLLVARVIWRKDRRFGLESRERINVRALAGGGSAEPAGPGAARRPARASAGRVEASRYLAGTMEFALIAVFALALVAALGATAFETLSRPFANVSSTLER